MPSPLNETIYNNHAHHKIVVNTTAPAGTHDIVINHHDVNLRNGFNVLIDTITGGTLTLHVSNGMTLEKDVTNCLFDVATLDASQPWICDINMPVERLIIRVTTTGGPVSFEFFASDS